MSGLYFHIPYCRKVCSYCNFHFSTNTNGMQELLDAMEKELETESSFLPDKTLLSIYFGGGTPSFCPPQNIERLMQKANELFTVQKGAEITLEANPEDIHQQNLQAWKSAGINRLSIGIQSLNETDLQYMNRNHNASQAREAVEMALDAGFPSLNIDLIFGSPWLNDDAWQKNLDWAFGCGADHISAYALTVEPKTFLNRKINNGEWPAVSDSRQAEQYKMLAQVADKWGWDFYEISNLSKPGHRAVHNSNYWKNLPYLGIGPSAHSFAGNTRRWNVRDNKKYTEMVQAGNLAYESETLTATDRYNEYLLTNIRTKEGIDLERVSSLGTKPLDILQKEISAMTEKGLMTIRNGHAVLTLEGRLLADWITSELMI